MKALLGRIICTGDVIVRVSATRYTGLDTYYVIDGYNGGTKIRALVVSPYSLEIVLKNENMPRMFCTAEYDPISKNYTHRPMSPDEIKHKLKKGTTHLSKGLNAYIINDDYAQEVKRLINAYR